MIKPTPVKSKLLVVLGGLCSALGVLAQTSTFTYQGQLSSNSVAPTGLFDARFTLYDAVTFGTQVGSVITVNPLGVTNGLFTTDLTYGASAFDGSSRWLEISIRPSGSASAYSVLSPRQAITATPYAVRALSVSGGLAATNLTGKINDTNLSANVALLTNNAVFTRSVVASNFIGSGLSLTNIPATNLIGTLPDARLSTNVAFLNTSNATFLGAITATNFYGEGRGLTNVPGRIFEFVPTAGNIQAFANYGYLATSDTDPVVVTLPPNHLLTNGNVVRISGIGAAGWVVAQNTNQSILVANLASTVGVGWTTNASGLNWNGIACSADGRRMVAVVNNGLIYTSTNYGATWGAQANSGSRAWTAVASSADGMKLAASVNAGQIFTSVDAGTNWVARGTSRNWTAIASTLDGSQITAASSQGVFVSYDGGTNWSNTPNLSAASWTGVASSGDGSNLVATALSQSIFVSTNAGTNWTGRDSARLWECVASSVDGSVLVAGVGTSGFLYTSTDFGATWVPGNVSANWATVACSADGGRMIAAVNGGGVYLSQDMGVSWTAKATLPNALAFTGTAASSDGSTLAAVATASGILVSSKTSTTSGTGGKLFGSRLAAIELQYVGNGVFIPISYVGNIRSK